MHTGQRISSHSSMSLAAAIPDSGVLREVDDDDDDDDECFRPLDELLGKGDARDLCSEGTDRVLLSFGILLD